MTFPDTDDSVQIAGFASQIVDYDFLFERLRAGTTLITANSRLARVLTEQYNQWRIELGDSQWASPAIVSWSLWLDELWETAGLQGVTGTDRAVPGSRQLVSLWESVLINEPLKHNLLRPESLASQLLDTRRLMTNWQLDFSHPVWFNQDNENHLAFYHWNKAFEKRCREDGWISPEDRIAILCTAINASQLSINGEFDLLGFDEFDPGQKTLLSALLDRSVELCLLSITARVSKSTLRKCRDGNKELEEMARWTRYWYEAEPDCSIAIVVPDLQTRRTEIERNLQEILRPGSNVDAELKPWNISMGVPLYRVPMIEAAFDLLKLLQQTIDIQDIGRVLKSPWLRGASSERNSRALLEKRLREKYPRQLKLGEFEFRSREIRTHDREHNEFPEDQQEPFAWNSPELTGVLGALTRFVHDTGGKKPASVWAEIIDQLLVSIGWPMSIDPEEAPPVDISTGEDGENWQTLQAWRDALRELASLDATDAPMSRTAAIGQLKQICRDQIFQAQTAKARIQVLGLYEISALRFDHLWVVGLHNENWPPAARPNPFIPAQLQRAANLPNSSPQRELEVTRVVTNRLLKTGTDCVFSYPGKLDGEDVIPSPLLSALMEPAVEELPSWNEKNWRNTVAAANGPSIEPLIAPGALTLGTARGGSSILKHQALCPFRAFASNRLGADSMESPADGISATLHGSLIHSVLEEFWKETKTWTALLALNEESLKDRIRKHVDLVTADERGLMQRPSFLGVEADRLCRHVFDFLLVDMSRDEFEVIGFEKQILPQIKGQTIRLIIDRIDRLPSGEEVIIDYKTGKVKADKWFGDRPEDPQMPLYAISVEDTPAAVAFGVVRDDGCHYSGVVTEDGIFPGLPKTGKTNQVVNDAGEDMPATIATWRQVIDNLMDGFIAGETSIDPKNGLKTCENTYCELQSVCRINELEQLRKAEQTDQAQGDSV